MSFLRCVQRWASLWRGDDPNPPRDPVIMADQHRVARAREVRRLQALSQIPGPVRLHRDVPLIIKLKEDD